MSPGFKPAKKRQLGGERRKITATRLIQERKAAATFRREEAKRLKKFGGKDPHTVPSGEVLRKAKEQELLKMYGLSFGNPAINLYNHAKNSKYADTIHRIGLHKFFCIYWMPEQQQIYAARCMQNSDAIFTIDATGGIVTLADKHDPSIMLYQCMIITNKGSVPVFQMVSADQTALAIGYFLWFILSKGAPILLIVVTDFGWALLPAVAKVFGMCHDLRNYLQTCYNVAVLGTDILPQTYIRLDVSHLIHMVTRWKCLREKGQAVRNFYKRCIGQAYQMSDLKTLAYFLESVLTVALSEYVGVTEKDDNMPSEVRLQYRNKTIRDITGNEIDEHEETADKHDEDWVSKNDIASTSDCNTWANMMYNSAENLAQQSKGGSIINGCYQPEFAKKLKKQLLPYVPLWKGVMRLHLLESSQSSGI